MHFPMGVSPGDHAELDRLRSTAHDTITAEPARRPARIRATLGESTQPALTISLAASDSATWTFTQQASLSPSP